MRFGVLLKCLKLFINNLPNSYVLKSEFASFGRNSCLEYPCHVESPRGVFVEENVNIRYGLQIINTKDEQVVIKRNSTLAPNVTIVTNNHVPTVGIPVFLLTSSHVNDKSSSVIIEDDCWIGTGAKLLAGCHIGRGSVVGAGAVVTKPVPSYAVVAGCPAKIIAVRFTIEQIIEHEARLYPVESRLSEEQIKGLFDSYFAGKRTIGVSAIDDPTCSQKLEAVKESKHYIDLGDIYE